MVRPFTPEEKESIRKILKVRGRELFGRYGLRKTSIADLIKGVGIAQGSFYLFYDSKEELFFDILEEEEQKIHREVLAGLGEGGLTPEVLGKLIRSALEAVKNNPILQNLYLQDEWQVLQRKLAPERVGGHIAHDTASLLPLIQESQRQGLMIDRKPQVIAGVLRALFTITLHRKEIGEDVFEEVTDLMIELICKGLIREGEDDGD